MKFSQTFTVVSDDVDQQAHVNNVAYVRWIQDVAVAHWIAVTNDAMRAEFTWVVLRHEIDYKKQGFEGDPIVVSTWVGLPERVCWERFTEVRRAGDLLVRARSVWCLLKTATMRPGRINDDLKRRLLGDEVFHDAGE